MPLLENQCFERWKHERWKHERWKYERKDLKDTEPRLTGEVKNGKRVMRRDCGTDMDIVRWIWSGILRCKSSIFNCLELDDFILK